jgi:hypothetical protein
MNCLSVYALEASGRNEDGRGGIEKGAFAPAEGVDNVLVADPPDDQDVPPPDTLWFAAFGWGN